MNDCVNQRFDLEIEIWTLASDIQISNLQNLAMMFRSHFGSRHILAQSALALAPTCG
jgi:hypothetical protein